MKTLILLLCVFIGTRALAAGNPPVPKPPGPGEFAIMNQPGSSLGWNSCIDLQLGGLATDAWLDASKWKIRLNGVRVGLGNVYPGTQTGCVRLLLARPSGEPSGPPKLDAAAIGVLSRDGYFGAPTALTLEFEGRPLRHRDAAEAAISFSLVDRVWLVVFIVILIAIGVVLFRVSPELEFLRDNDPRLPAAQRAFSLARFQLAIWTALVGGCFIAIHLLTGQILGILNSTALSLLGISSVTTLASVALDSNQSTTAVNSWAVAPQSATAPVRHRGFWQDIISDSNGTSLHRVQILMWTLTLASIYVYETIRSLKLPDFDPQTFGLMGISSATYVWLKQRE